ncbi:hypothetical protein MKZ38_002839 [Zalerion maritima]|uniref:Uncharacterized protein n=1 Tax=Zalerion maritima TaxID=339359 RepID=A0AAD5RYI8_9PEZI|nr:hypothetical protein MKZ38_002839 [Zalerion maritima]
MPEPPFHLRPQPTVHLLARSVPVIPPPAFAAADIIPSPPKPPNSELVQRKILEGFRADLDEETAALAERLRVFDLTRSDIEMARNHQPRRQRRKGVFEAFGLTPEAVSRATSETGSTGTSRQSSAQSSANKATQHNGPGEGLSPQIC